MQQSVVLGRDGQVREQRVAVRPAGFAFDARYAGWLRRPRPPEVVEPKRHGRVGLRLARHAASNGHVYTHGITKLKKLKIKKIKHVCYYFADSAAERAVTYLVKQYN